jgi:hypothetical protein
MTLEELDTIERALTVLPVRDGDCAAAKSVAREFNALVQQERARLAAARAMIEQARALSPESEIELKAYAVMVASERERIVRQWGMSARP